MIRDYRDEDLGRVMDIWLAASRVGHPFLSEEQLAKDRQEIIEHAIPEARQWLYENEGEIVGFIALIGEHIGGLFVDPAYHRQGIGRALVNHARGMYERLTVNVFRDNRNGIAFYEGVGFAFVREQISEYFGLPEWVMEIEGA
ncbi:MAG TPA: GNAT family N-acetyltransferase [bacterium]|nr:GNAT family N-acetyltransferase [bacterium]